MKASNLIIIILTACGMAFGLSYYNLWQQRKLYTKIDSQLSYLQKESTKNDSLLNLKLDSLAITASELSARLVTIQKSNETIRKRNALQTQLVDSLFRHVIGRPDF
jgi:hypothetical protein